MSPPHAEPPEEQSPQHPGKVPRDQILALQHAHGAKASLSMCPEAEREQVQPGWTDGWTRGGERGNRAVTPRTSVPARGGGVLSISWPAEPSHPTNLPQHHWLPKDHVRTTRHIPATKFGGRWGWGGDGSGGRTHICDAFRGHPASGQPGHSPASSRLAPGGERCHITRQKSPPPSLPLLLPSPEEGNSPPHRCPVYQELVPSTRENSRSISRPCFHSADTHYL